MNPPADWYPDPTGRHEQRYWDGGQWTEHVFTDGVQGVDPLDDAAPAEAEAETVDEEAATADVATESGAAEPAADDETPAFAAAYSEQAGETVRRDDDSADLWTPAGEEPEDDTPDGDAAPEPEADADDAPAARDDEESVATDVSAEDVVASLDEMGAGTDDDGQPVAMQDAFVLSPETASRLVGTPDAETPLADAPPPDADAIAAPPPSVAAMTASSSSAGLGITGDLVSGAFSEREGDGPVALQNVRLLRCRVSPGSGVVARQGTMVAYQGQVQFERQGAGGVGRALKRAATGEGMAMMRVEGNGDVFFADDAQHVFLLELDGSGPGISVNGRNVLAFSAALNWDIERVKGASLLAGGLFNTTLTGTGWVALVADGEPVVLRTDEAPTYVDVNALVAWSGGLSTRVVNQVSAKSLVGLGSGEAFQMAFDGTGVVIVQPSEGPMQGAAAT